MLIHTVHKSEFDCGYPVDNGDNLSQTSGKVEILPLNPVDKSVESVDESTA